MGFPASATEASQDASSTAFGVAAATLIADARDYDWTYSTTWPGNAETAEKLKDFVDSSVSAFKDAIASQRSFVPGTDPIANRIPIERLGPSSGEPILFYDDLILFEDELGDNGSSMLGVKVRVMPSGFLILQRFFLRVDDVVFRLFDTRMYCAFNEPAPNNAITADSASALRVVPSGQPLKLVPSPAVAPWAAPRPLSTLPSATQSTLAADIASLSLGSARTKDTHNLQSGGGDQPPKPPVQRLVRELSGSEAPYKDVKARIPPYRPNDLSLLTDPAWVSETLKDITARQFASAPGGGGDASQHPSLAETTAAQAVLPARQLGATQSRSESQSAAPGPAVIGEIGEEDIWEGVGQRVDIVILQ